MNSEALSINQTEVLLDATHDPEGDSASRTQAQIAGRLENGQIIASDSIRRPAAQTGSNQTQQASGYYSSFGVYFEPGMDEGAPQKSVKRESFSLICKVALGFTAWRAQELGSSSWGIAALCCCVLLLFSENCISYEKLYDSVFSFTNTVTLALLLIKLHLTSSLTVEYICLLNSVSGIFALFTALTLPAVLLLLLRHRTSVACQAALEATVRYSNLFAFGAFMLAIPAHFEHSETWLKLDLYESSGLYAATSLVQAIFFVIMRHRVNSIAQPPQKVHRYPSAQIDVKTTSRIFNIIKKSSNFFIHQSIGSTQEAAGEQLNAPEEDLCAICYAEKPECLILPCYHAGVCASCAKELLKGNKKCHMCRVEIGQIFVIEPHGNSYRAKEEIVPL